jgi:hypothetical protein
MKRVTAILGAIALVLVAVGIRSVVNNGSDNDAKSGGGSSDRPVVACTTDLARVCEALAADGVIAADTPPLDLADAADAATVKDLDGWITWSPASAVANLDNPQSPQWDTAGYVLGSATPALAIRGASDVAMPKGCIGATIKPDCVVRLATEAHAAVGVGDPQSAEGLDRLRSLAPVLVPDGETNPSKDAQTLNDSPPGEQDTATETMHTMIVQGGAFDAVLGPKPLLDRASETSQARDADIRVTPLHTSDRLEVMVVARANQEPLQSVIDARSDKKVKAALAAVGMGAGSGDEADQSQSGKLWQLRDKVG